MTNTGALITGGSAIGLSLIATRIDLNLMIFILVFFSLVNAVIMYQYAKNKEGAKFDYMDFVSFTIVAIATGILFASLGLISGAGELYVYVWTMAGCISGKRGIEIAFRWLSKKFTGKEIYLFDKD